MRGGDKRRSLCRGAWLALGMYGFAQPCVYAVRGRGRGGWGGRVPDMLGVNAYKPNKDTYSQSKNRWSDGWDED